MWVGWKSSLLGLDPVMLTRISSSKTPGLKSENAKNMSLSNRSSSGEEDGDADWKAAIDSVANGFATNSSHSPKPNGVSSRRNKEEEDVENSYNPQPLKLYQIKAQKLLEDLVEKSIVIVNDPVPEFDNEPTPTEGGIRLFRKAPLGIADPIDEVQQPRKRPKILPGEVVNEKSKKFRCQLQTVVVDGVDVMAAAIDASQKSLARFEAKDAAAKAAAKREEERVTALKKIRGEKWLPSIAKEMKGRK
ncbi:hypothetical protein FRX31_030718 [Thalictrum thalictroides]|uniref:Uncharacterized protein n=1 Tax=Thalictrum thalictroides TaxID=46969 RepID=A0A7J6V5L1_THATH|nr:hypothetical protein FRX31_030718 [Thalictrum thalictroides]